MSKRLSDNLNSRYVDAFNSLRPKQAKRKIVAYVESYDDVFFWRSVLADFENEQFGFEVMLPSRNTLQKGKKSALMNELGGRLGRYMIACVDADYDYLMQDGTETSRMVNHHPFVFHTYVYAIENYQCYAPGLHSVCVMATLNDRKIVDLEAFMRLYSEIIYPLFLWSVWCYKHGTFRDFSLSDFGDLVSFDDINVYHPERTLEALRHRVNRKMAWLQHRFQQARADYNRLRDELTELGVTPETTYLYMQGHALFDGVVRPVLEPICAQLRRERERDIKQLAEHDVQRQNELSCYQHSQASVEMMLKKSDHFKHSAPYQRLKADLTEFLQGLEK
jgi:hypothetical protein